MSSPLNDPQVEQWFQRFSAPLKRLPAAERAELHQEVRQHLDALAAANEELGSSPEEARQLALTQFGDPRVIGARLFQECQESRNGSRLGWSAIGLGVLLYLGCIMIHMLPIYFHARPYGILPSTVLDYGYAALMSFAIGWKYPFHATRGTLYALLFWRTVFLCRILSLMLIPHYETNGGHTSHTILSLNIVNWISPGLLGILINGGAAYLASVTKRGWYKPALADFKIVLPRRQRKLSR